MCKFICADCLLFLALFIGCGGFIVFLINDDNKHHTKIKNSQHPYLQVVNTGYHLGNSNTHEVHNTKTGEIWTVIRFGHSAYVIKTGEADGT